MQLIETQVVKLAVTVKLKGDLHVRASWRRSPSHKGFQPLEEVRHISVKSRCSNPWVSYLQCVCLSWYNHGLSTHHAPHITWSTVKSRCSNPWVSYLQCVCLSWYNRGFSNTPCTPHHIKHPQAWCKHFRSNPKIEHLQVPNTLLQCGYFTCAKCSSSLTCAPL
jgi:hypothetical protein